ncbi:MAG: hypothetical protein ACERLM_12745 [Acidimicrobiales bacterium]
MKKTLLTIAATAGIALGGMSAASVASAQSYGDDSSTETAVVEDVDQAEVQSPEALPVQDENDGQSEDAEPNEDAQANEEGERGRHRRGGCGNLDAAAEAIGVEVDDLRSALDDGQSIADVATANDVDPDTVVDAMVASADEHLAEKVEAGRLTQEEADERLAEKTERINDRVFDTETEVEADETA